VEFVSVVVYRIVCRTGAVQSVINHDVRLVVVDTTRSTSVVDIRGSATSHNHSFAYKVTWRLPLIIGVQIPPTLNQREPLHQLHMNTRQQNIITHHLTIRWIAAKCQNSIKLAILALVRLHVFWSS